MWAFVSTSREHIQFSLCLPKGFLGMGRITIVSRHSPNPTRPFGLLGPIEMDGAPYLALTFGLGLFIVNPVNPPSGTLTGAASAGCFSFKILQGLHNLIYVMTPLNIIRFKVLTR